MDHQDQPLKSVTTPHFIAKIYFCILIQIKKLMHLEAFAGVLLIAAAAIALFWANSSFYTTYVGFWHTKLGISLGKFSLNWDLHFWVNDVLMTFFFLIAGLEIRKEIHNGALSSIKQATLPIIAALGGVLVPALIYMLFNTDPISHHGWAVPTATDIAFAVGILALLGRSLPSNIRVVLLSLAIIDDIIAVLIIAVFYSNGIDASALLIAVAAIGLIYIFHFFGISSAFAYALPASVLWFGLWKTGIHPSLAGVILGLLTPIIYQPLQLGKDNKPYKALINPLAIVEKHLHPWVAFFIMPVFALANAGIYLGDINLSANGTFGITMGVMAGLIIGKPLGIILTSFIAVKLGACRLPPQVDWRAMILVGLLAGIGFTMAIFVAMLAFSNPEQLASAKIGVLLGSGLSAIIGLIYGFLYLGYIKQKQN
ncbi:Na+/H+ antiporter NhaA [Bartonella sp. HY406]|uniref:Na+/H+ antiporter NhaA n=1 Tax=Bartonella sp. HY406 TaxID=2979331 RepID=UPI0021CA2767|nr:Na+/H+ antiporter NhaA [Bartonella sp. HY406]UXN04364.1 Na+/H+ antiporter NhaA [Bartonella sp. HY406]